MSDKEESAYKVRSHLNRSIDKVLDIFDKHISSTDLESKLAKDEILEELCDTADKIYPLLCAIIGNHDPVTDHCLKPEHDYCEVCGVLTPGQAKRNHIKP